MPLNEEKPLELSGGGPDPNRQERRARDALELANVGVFEQSEDGEVWWSDAMYQLLGLDSGDFTPVAASVAGRVHPDDRAALEQVVDQIGVGDRPQRLVVRMCHDDGRWLEFGLAVRRVVRGGRPTIHGTLQELEPWRELRLEAVSPILDVDVDGCSHGTFICHRSGRFTEVNRIGEAMTGYSRAELLELDYTELVEHSHRVEARARFAGLFEDGLLTWEVPVVRKGGEVRWWSVSAVRLSADRCLGFTTDIDERMRADEALRESELKYRTLVEASPYCIHQINPAGQVASMNRAGLDMLGLVDEADVVGQPYVKAVSRDDQPRVLDLMKAAFAGTFAEFEFRGAEREAFRSIFVPLPGPSGEIAGLLGITQDVTQLRRAEEALRESNVRFLEICEHIEDVYWLADASNPDAYRTLYVNRAFEQLWQRSASEVYADASVWYSCIHQEDRARVVEAFRRLMEGRGHFDATFRIIRPDGTERTVVSRGQAIREHGKIVRVAGIARDITPLLEAQRRQQELEASMLHTQKLESLGVMAGGIAHDFNNLLLPITMAVEMIAMQSAAGRVAAPNDLERIRVASRKAAELCRQLLAYSGRGHFQARPLDLSAEVRASAELFQISGKAAELAYDLQEQLPKAMVDSAQFQQIMMNLVVNATEAAGRDPLRIEIRTGAATMSREELRSQHLGSLTPEPGEYVFFEVADNGVGMDEETAARLFEPFYTTKFTGRGLGLAAVLGIVRGHCGSLVVDTTAGVGTRVRVLFPATKVGRHCAQAPESSASKPTQCLTVLVVDDEVQVRESAAAGLRQAGHRVLLAEGGRQAVEVFRARQSVVDMVLLDLTMPGLGGEATFAELRKIDPNVQIVMTSGYPQSAVVDSRKVEGLAGYLQKPYDPDGLVAALTQAHQTHRPVS